MSVIRICIISCLLIFGFLSQDTQAEEWIMFDRNEVGTFFYDKSSIKVEPDVRVKVAMKQVLAEDFGVNLEKAIPEMKDVSYQIVYDEIDCRKGIYCQERVVTYDKNGKAREPMPGWHKTICRPIQPDTIIANLALRVCKEE